MTPLLYYIIFSALLFSVGLAGALTRRNAILVLIGIELMLNAANLCPSSGPVLETMYKMTKDMDQDPSQDNRAKLGDGREETRKLLAQFLRVTPEEIVITRNTSESNNLVSTGVTFPITIVPEDLATSPLTYILSIAAVSVHLVTVAMFPFSLDTAGFLLSVSPTCTRSDARTWLPLATFGAL